MLVLLAVAVVLVTLWLFGRMRRWMFERELQRRGEERKAAARLRADGAFYDDMARRHGLQ